ncbi:MAG: hypothetical protein IJK97_05895, partial [Thermoguttaceae bacterium]|nr:hypothetical protein [Thermoguttaceae bacterium]
MPIDFDRRSGFDVLHLNRQCADRYLKREPIVEVLLYARGHFLRIGEFPLRNNSGACECLVFYGVGFARSQHPSPLGGSQ